MAVERYQIIREIMVERQEGRETETKTRISDICKAKVRP